MSKNKQTIMPIDVLRGRLATLITERIELEIDLEKDIEESNERYPDEGFPSTIRLDQDFWRTEIYKYEFCIEEIERLIKMIE